jgi:hypothetical protein
VNLPFTSDQFFEAFAEYNRLLWPFALALWVSALAGVVILAREREGGGRFVATMLSVQWMWVALAYHAAFFSTINPAAWLFASLSLLQGALFAWFGIVRNQLHFAPTGSPRHAVAWTLIVYSLVYPIIARAEGHVFPAAPTFGLPCPTTLLTAGILLTAVAPWPRAVAVIPVLWGLVGGSASLLLGVRADLMLYVAAVALTTHTFAPARSRLHT